MAVTVSTAGSAVLVEGSPMPPAMLAAPGPSVAVWREYVNMGYWQKMWGNAGMWGYLACCFLLGMATGYFVRRYARTCLIALGGALVVGAFCEQFGIISVHGEVVRSFFGTSIGQSVTDSATQLFELVKQNAMVYGAALGGFITGHMMSHVGD